MRKLFSIIILFLAIFLVVIPKVNSQDKTPSATNVSQTTVIDNDYLAANDEVQISGTVNGDAYLAGGIVRIDGTVNKDLLAAGGNILITGKVLQDVRVVGGNVTFSGATVGGNITILGGQIILDRSTTVGGSIVSAGGNIQILSPVTKGVTIAGGNVEIGNKVGGNVMAAVGQLSLLNGTSVEGNLNYISESKANISDGATVSGTVRQQFPPRENKTKVQEAGKSIAAAFAGILFFIKIADIIMLLILGLLFIKLFPIYSQKLSTIISNEFPIAILVGLGFIVFTPLIALIIVMTVVGIPLAFFIMMLYGAILWFARVVGIYSITQMLLERGAAANKSKRSLSWTYVIGLLVYTVISLIPVISIFLDIVVCFSGVGAIVLGKKYTYTELRKKKLI